jgi:hypothetical protein
MERYLLLRFAHLVGLMLMSAGLIGVFVADMPSRQVRDVKLFAQAVTFIAVFYDGLVVPGALVLLASGTWLIVSSYGGWEFLKVVGRSANGAPPVAAEAPVASDNKPAAPSTGTAFAPRFRFRVCFAFGIINLPSILWVSIDCGTQLAFCTLGSGAKQARTSACR